MNDGQIRVLPIHVANKISAGEVVERPASVVKELVENAIDAGARNIRISIEQGGKKLISVQDDGCGMSKENALLSLERQATSKIRDESDIERIATLGFRGEAIPSIASVSRFSMTTRRKDDDEGFFLIVNAGTLTSSGPAGCPGGTVISVKDLFMNVPARLKFLKSRATEESHIKHVFTVHALAHPSIAFSLSIDGRDAGSLPRASSLAERMHDLFGGRFLETAVAIPPAPDEGGCSPSAVKVTGYIEKIDFSTPMRREQYIFVNSRPATAPTIAYAIREAYPRKQGDVKPGAVLFIEVPPSQVDVNVHPMKREVRFRDNAAVRRAVESAIRRAFFAPGVETSIGNEPPCADEPADTASAQSPSGANVTPHFDIPGRVHRTFASPSPAAPAAVPESAPVEVELMLSDDGDSSKPWRWFKFLTQTSKGYLILETDAGIVTVNPAAARERIVYERIRDRKSPSQPLLIPKTVNLAPADASRISSALPILRDIGFSIEPFGKNTLKVEAIPQIASKASAESILTTISQDLSVSSPGRGGERWREELIAKAVARSFAGAMTKLSDEGAAEMMEELCSCKMPYVCPRGKPVMIFTSNRELERRFDRR